MTEPVFNWRRGYRVAAAEGVDGNPDLVWVPLRDKHIGELIGGDTVRFDIEASDERPKTIVMLRRFPGVEHVALIRAAHRLAGSRPNATDPSYLDALADLVGEALGMESVQAAELIETAEEDTE